MRAANTGKNNMIYSIDSSTKYSVLSSLGVEIDGYRTQVRHLYRLFRHDRYDIEQVIANKGLRQRTMRNWSGTLAHRGPFPGDFSGPE